MLMIFLECYNLVYELPRIQYATLYCVSPALKYTPFYQIMHTLTMYELVWVSGFSRFCLKLYTFNWMFFFCSLATHCNFIPPLLPMLAA